MKEVSNIMENNSVKAQAEETEHCGNIITEMLLTRPDHTHVTQMDVNIVYYVAGFISKSVKKAVTCVVGFLRLIIRFSTSPHLRISLL